MAIGRGDGTMLYSGNDTKHYIEWLENRVEDLEDLVCEIACYVGEDDWEHVHKRMRDEDIDWRGADDV